MAKNGNLWYKFATARKFWGSTEKVEYRCTTTNIPVCNDTIIVLKITLLHSVSVITNFVIPKRDIQTKKTSHFFVYSRRATHDPQHTWHADRGGPCHFCTRPANFFDPITSFAASCEKPIFGPLSKRNNNLCKLQVLSTYNNTTSTTLQEHLCTSRPTSMHQLGDKLHDYSGESDM